MVFRSPSMYTLAWPICFWQFFLYFLSLSVLLFSFCTTQNLYNYLFFFFFLYCLTVTFMETVCRANNTIVIIVMVDVAPPGDKTSVATHSPWCSKWQQTPEQRTKKGQPPNIYLKIPNIRKLMELEFKRWFSFPFQNNLLALSY